MPIPLIKLGKELHQIGAKDEIAQTMQVRRTQKEMEAMVSWTMQTIVDNIYSQGKFDSVNYAAIRDEGFKELRVSIDRYFAALADMGDSFEQQGFVRSRQGLLKTMGLTMKIPIKGENGAILHECEIHEAVSGGINLTLGSGNVNEDFKAYTKKRLQLAIDNPGTYIKTVGTNYVSLIQKEMLSGLDKGRDLMQSKDEVLRKLKLVTLSKELRQETEYKVMRIMRTEYAAAANAVTYQFGKENARMIKGYSRVADGRPCFICQMLDGRFYELNQPHDDHPNGMCRWVPIMRLPSEMGFNVKGLNEKAIIKQQTMTPMRVGLNKMSDKELLNLIGNKTTFDLFKNSALTLDDLLVKKGGQWVQRSATDLMNFAAKHSQMAFLR